MQVDHWISVAANFNGSNIPLCDVLEKSLSLSTYLVGQELTAADLAIWGSIYGEYIMLLSYPIDFNFVFSILQFVLC